MNISGIRASAGFYDYNSIKSSELKSRQMEESEAVQQEEKPLVQEKDLAADADRQFTSYDYAKQYEPDASYDLKGADSELALLDVEKVLSDVQKDAVLQQYQFFVSGQNASAPRNAVNDFGENFII